MFPQYIFRVIFLCVKTSLFVPIYYYLHPAALSLVCISVLPDFPETSVAYCCILDLWLPLQPHEKNCHKTMVFSTFEMALFADIFPFKTIFKIAFKQQKGAYHISHDTQLLQQVDFKVGISHGGAGWKSKTCIVCYI